MIDYEDILGTPYGLPTWLIERLEDCPESGCGVHSEWMPSVTNSLAHFVSPEEAVDIIKEYMTRNPNPSDEVERTVDNIYNAKDYKSSDSVRKPKQPKQSDVIDPDKLS
jgi:hypothetical protein